MVRGSARPPLGSPSPKGARIDTGRYGSPAPNRRDHRRRQDRVRLPRTGLRRCGLGRRARRALARHGRPDPRRRRVHGAHHRRRRDPLGAPRGRPHRQPRVRPRDRPRRRRGHAVGSRSVQGLGVPLAYALAARGADRPMDVWTVENADVAPVLDAAVRAPPRSAASRCRPSASPARSRSPPSPRATGRAGRPEFVGDSARWLLVDATRLITPLPRLARVGAPTLRGAPALQALRLQRRPCACAYSALARPHARSTRPRPTRWCARCRRCACASRRALLGRPSVTAARSTGCSSATRTTSWPTRCGASPATRSASCPRRAARRPRDARRRGQGHGARRLLGGHRQRAALS